MSLLTSPDLATTLRNVDASGVYINDTKTGALLADAIEIADSCARSDIECNLPGDETGCYDTTATKEDHDAWLAQSLRYLEARGLIERSPHARHIVRFPKVTP